MLIGTRAFKQLKSTQGDFATAYQEFRETANLEDLDLNPDELYERFAKRNCRPRNTILIGEISTRYEYDFSIVATRTKRKNRPVFERTST